MRIAYHIILTNFPGTAIFKKYQRVLRCIIKSVISKKFYSAKETAEVLGISKQTLVRYEKKGFFPKPRRNMLNHWREYVSEDIQKLKKIMGRTD